MTPLNRAQPRKEPRNHGTKLAAWILGCLVVCFTADCRPAPTHSAVRTSESAAPEPLHVPKQMLVVGHDTVLVEVADNEPQREVGLMFRTVMAENEGMLFVFDSEGIYPFWMRNTELPLSIAFIDRAGIIADIQDMAPHDERTDHSPPRPILYALEMNQGWFERHRVVKGDTVQVGPWRVGDKR